MSDIRRQKLHTAPPKTLEHIMTHPPQMLTDSSNIATSQAVIIQQIPSS